MSDFALIQIEVAYASPTEQAVLSLRVPIGTSVEAAIRASGILQHFPEIDLATAPLGRFAKRCGLDDLVQSGDRIEIYRPLLADPKEVRRLRAEKRPLRGRRKVR